MNTPMSSPASADLSACEEVSLPAVSDAMTPTSTPEQRLAHLFRRQRARPTASPLQRAVYRYRGVPL